MKIKILFIFLLVKSIGFSQEFILESVKFTEPLYKQVVYEFPRLKSVVKENKPIVDKINKQILSGLMLNSYAKEDMYSKEDRAEGYQFKWSDLEYNYEIKDEILYLTFHYFYYAAYPMYNEQTYFFDLKSGERLPSNNIAFHSLFTTTGYLDFINTYWLDSVKSKFAESFECADEEPACSYYDIDSYWIDTNNNVSISLTDDCYEHYSYACTPEFTLKIDRDSIKQYLNAVGNYMLIESDYFSITEIEKYKKNDSLRNYLENNLYIFAEIDSKYPITMAMTSDEQGEISGYYYYNKNRVNIALKGHRVDDVLLITESYKNKVTGLFEFKINTEYDYIESGKWSNPAKTKTYDINIIEVK